MLVSSQTHSGRATPTFLLPLNASERMTRVYAVCRHSLRTELVVRGPTNNTSGSFILGQCAGHLASVSSTGLMNISEHLQFDLSVWWGKGVGGHAEGEQTP